MSDPDRQRSSEVDTAWLRTCLEAALDLRDFALSEDYLCALQAHEALARGVPPALEAVLPRLSAAASALCLVVIELKGYDRHDDVEPADRIDAAVRAAQTAEDGSEMRIPSRVVVLDAQRPWVRGHLLPVDLGLASLFAERVRQGFPPPTCSCVGVAMLRPGESAASLLARADAALELARRGGGDRVELALASPTLRRAA